MGIGANTMGPSMSKEKDQIHSRERTWRKTRDKAHTTKKRGSLLSRSSQITNITLVALEKRYKLSLACAVDGGFKGGYK